MRILHVTDVYRPRVGGIETFVEGLAARQVDEGHDVTVLCPTPDRPGAHDLVDVERVPLGGYVLLATLPVDLSSYDVVHAHLSVVSVFTTRVAKAAAKAGVPVVMTVHSMWNGREGWVRIVRALAAWDRLPQVWTAVSEHAADAMRAALASRTPVRVVPNAVDVEWWHSLPREPDEHYEHDEHDEHDHVRPVTFVSVMRLAGRKRPLQLLEVLAAARREVSAEVPMRAVVIGDGPLAARVRARCEDLGLDWVELVGHLSPAQIRRTYADADAFFAPSHQESFGIAALEARAAGVPVVAMRSGGVGEFVQDGVEGLLCDDDEEMARAAVRLASDDALRARLQWHARAAAPKHDWAQALAAFEQVYGEARDAADTGSRVSRVAG